MNKIPRPIIQAFKNAKGVKVISSDFYLLAENRSFLIRVVEKESGIVQDMGERKWAIQFAYKPTFDRWANSVNFISEIWYSPKKNRRYAVGALKGKRMPQYTIPKIEKEIEWCSKIAASNLINFNSYFFAINTPWIIY